MGQTKEQLYQAEDCGLLIGLINVPIGTDIADFFNNEMNNIIFQTYRADIFNNDNNNSNTNYLYKPHAYHLLGDHNLAVLSLVDDFAFAQRVFYSSHCFPRGDIKKPEEYMIQTITGISTYPLGQQPRLVDMARKTFLLSANTIPDKLQASIEPYPFIGIVRYKLNNGLLIGNGQDYLEAVKTVLEKNKNDDLKDVPLFMIDSFCNNELTLVIFTHDPKEIIDFVMKSRQLKIDDLNKSKHIYENALQGKITKTPQENEFNNLHLFSSSHTMLGFDLDLFTQTEFSENLKQITFPVKFYWDIKPGHIHNINTALEDIIKHLKLTKKQGKKKIIAGISSLVYEQVFTLPEYISFIKAWQDRKEKNTNDLRHVRISMETEISNPGEEIRHPLNRLFDALKIKEEEILPLHDKLLSLGIPKVLEQRIQRVYTNFNECISDPLFAIYFMELRDYLACLPEIVKDVELKKDMNSRHEMLNDFIANFEKAYYNRFHHSNRVIGMDDFNLEYNGGIQQLLSGFDAVYKYIAHLFSEIPATDYDTSEEKNTQNKRQSFPDVVCVSGYERVYSDKWRMMINILYITYPELFAATIWKEALNFFFRNNFIEHLEKIIHTKDFEHLFNQLKNTKFPDFLRNQIRMDESFNETAYSHHLLNQALHENFLKYIMIDGLVFKAGYKEDFDLFYYWYWKVFLQMNHLMEKKDKEEPIEYSPNNFITMLFRLTYWAHYLDQTSGSAGTRINDIRNAPFDPALRGLWILHFNDVYTYVKIFFNKLKSIHFNDFIDSIADDIDPQTSTTSPSQETDSLTEEPMEDLHKLRKEHKKIYQKMLETPSAHFEKNEIITYNKKDKKTLYLSLVLRAYLKQIKELDLQGVKLKPDTCYTLKRTPQGGKIQHKDNYTNLLSDPYGGMFIINNNPEIRKKYYILRSLFYKCIWDFSMRSKAELFPDTTNKQKK